MAKLTLSDITSGYASTTALNDNFNLIETALENTLSRDGTTPNSMSADLDMNGKLILNVGNAVQVSGFTWEGPWVTDTNYSIGDIVENNGSAYMCTVAHKAGIFNTDFTDLKWQLFATASVPSQTGNASKFIQTNGSSMSWEVPDASEISFLQSGTGAVARTAQAKLRDAISIQDFGGIGDGTTDNYSKFVAAMATLSVAGGGTLYVPGGASNDYLFKTQAGASPSIGIPSNVTIIADPDVYFLVEGGASAAGVNTYATALFKNADMVNGNKNIAVIGGRFKSTTATNCGGFLAFKNVLGLHIERVQLLDIVGACRFQASYCANVKLLNGLVDYETPHATPWSYEDGLRIGSGCINVQIANWRINSGDDCLAINNELSETQMAITPQTGLPAYNVNGALIKNVSISNVDVECQAGNALRVYQGPGMTVGTITRINVSNMHGKPRHPTTGWSTAISLYDNSGSTTNAISEVVISGFNLDCSFLGTSGSGTPAAIHVQTTGGGIKIANGFLGGVTVPYGIVTNSGTQISSVNIAGCANDSIYVEGDYNVITGCLLSNAGVYGIHVSAAASQTIITGNKVFNSASSAVKEDAGAAYTTCTGNDFTFSPAPAVAGNASSFYDRNLGFLNPTCSVYRSGNQSISSGVYTKVQLNGEDFDTNNNFDSTTNYRFQPTVPGYYQIDGKVSSSGSTAAGSCAAAIYKNGSAYKYGPYVQTTSAESCVSTIVYLNGSTDFIELYAYITATTAVVGGGSNTTYLSATMIRG